MHYKKYAQLPHEEKWNGFRLDYKYIEGFSPLFYETGGTHWDLDHDADNFLRSVIFRYWLDSEDSPGPETQYLKSLKEKKIQIDQDRERFFLSSAFYQSKDRDPVEDLFNRSKDKHPHEIMFSQMCRELESIDSKVFRFIPEYLREVISSGMVYDGDIDHQKEHENTQYKSMIIREPGKYLFQYFHDQLVFDNYVQIITVPRMDEKAINLLDSGKLLDPPEDESYGWNLDRIMSVVEDNYRGWWT